MAAEMAGRARAEGLAALEALDRALARRPERDGQAFVEMTEHLCRMRDLLIAQGRAERSASAELEQLNAIISTALAGHFPLGQTPWPEVEHARGTLRELLDNATRSA